VLQQAALEQFDAEKESKADDWLVRRAAQVPL
jgi:hypothetical protein